MDLQGRERSGRLRRTAHCVRHALCLCESRPSLFATLATQQRMGLQKDAMRDPQFTPHTTAHDVWLLDLRHSTLRTASWMGLKSFVVTEHKLPMRTQAHAL